MEYEKVAKKFGFGRNAGNTITIELSKSKASNLLSRINPTKNSVLRDNLSVTNILSKITEKLEKEGKTGVELDNYIEYFRYVDCGCCYWNKKRD